jgi:hypothetical protein
LIFLLIGSSNVLLDIQSPNFLHEVHKRECMITFLIKIYIFHMYCVNLVNI